jgi:hypothetical protein
MSDTPIAGMTGSGKGSARWRAAWTIDFGAGAELAEIVPPAALSAQRGRTRRRPFRLGSVLRLPSRRRSRTEVEPLEQHVEPMGTGGERDGAGS